MLIAAGVLAAIAAIGTIIGGFDTALGIFAVMLAPLLIILAGVQLVIALSRPISGELLRNSGSSTHPKTFTERFDGMTP